MLPNKDNNEVNQHATITHEHYNFHADPESAIKAVMAENKQLKADNKELKNDKQILKDLVQFLKDKVALLEAQANQPSATKDSPSKLSVSGPSAPEFEQLKKDLAQARRELKAAQDELGVLKTDIDNFKIWTKKLDWSTTDQPTWLDKYFDIKQVEGVKSTLTGGTPITVCGQMVDGVLHGPVVYTKDTDGSVSYICADEQTDGVSVGVLTKAGQNGIGFPLKNGYNIQLHLYKEEAKLEHYQNSKVVSAKWYQLKK